MTSNHPHPPSPTGPRVIPAPCLPCACILKRPMRNDACLTPYITLPGGGEGGMACVRACVSHACRILLVIRYYSSAKQNANLSRESSILGQLLSNPGLHIQKHVCSCVKGNYRAPSGCLVGASECSCEVKGLPVAYTARKKGVHKMCWLPFALRLVQGDESAIAADVDSSERVVPLMSSLFRTYVSTSS